jgi:aminoglycoside phosphotransferase
MNDLPTCLEEVASEPVWPRRLVLGHLAYCLPNFLLRERSVEVCEVRRLELEVWPEEVTSARRRIHHNAFEMVLYEQMLVIVV